MSEPATPDAIVLPWPRRACKLKPTMQKLSACFNMRETKIAILERLYDTNDNTSTVSTTSTGVALNICLSNILQNTPEQGVAVWGFVQDRALRNELLLLLYHTFSPRVAFAANTRQSFFECILVINMSSLKDAKDKAVTVAQVEHWLDTFLDCLGISAGVICFDKYMDDPMVTCIDRIEMASIKDGCFGTLFDADNRDFYRLYAHCKNMMHARADANLQTGMQLDTATLVRMYRQQVVMQRQLAAFRTRENISADAHAREQRIFQRARRGNLEVATILMNMHRTGTITQDMRNHMLSLLGLAATSVSTSNLESFFTSTTDNNSSSTPGQAVFSSNETFLLLRSVSVA